MDILLHTITQLRQIENTTQTQCKEEFIYCTSCESSSRGAIIQFHRGVRERDKQVKSILSVVDMLTTTTMCAIQKAPLLLPLLVLVVLVPALATSSQVLFPDEEVEDDDLRSCVPLPECEAYYYLIRNRDDIPGMSRRDVFE